MNTKGTLSNTEIAVHEAGHVVACYRLFPRCMVGPLTIVAVHEEKAAGSHETLKAMEFELTDDPVELENRNDDWFRKEEVYACAGYAALIATGYTEGLASHGCEADFERAAGIADITLDDAKQRAVDLMRQPENVAAVARIAREFFIRRAIDPEDIGVLISVANGATTESEYQSFRRARDKSRTQLDTLSREHISRW